jgi:hypothetical protein
MQYRATVVRPGNQNDSGALREQSFGLVAEGRSFSKAAFTFISHLPGRCFPAAAVLLSNASLRSVPAPRPTTTQGNAQPMTFRYKHQIDPEGIAQFGLVAEDVEKVNPDLVVHDKEGKPYTVRYEAINAMLLNEFLKEHTTVEELKATVAQQQKQIEALAGGLEKVSAQLELSKPAPQTVLNKQ